MCSVRREQATPARERRENRHVCLPRLVGPLSPPSAHNASLPSSFLQCNGGEDYSMAVLKKNRRTSTLEKPLFRHTLPKRALLRLSHQVVHFITFSVREGRGWYPLWQLEEELDPAARSRYHYPPYRWLRCCTSWAARSSRRGCSLVSVPGGRTCSCWPAPCVAPCRPTESEIRWGGWQ